MEKLPFNPHFDQSVDCRPSPDTGPMAAVADLQALDCQEEGTTRLIKPVLPGRDM